MDEEKNNNMTARQEKRRKYWKEAKSSQRVTRARTMKDEGTDEQTTPSATPTISSQGFKTNMPIKLTSHAKQKKKPKSPLKHKNVKNITKGAKNVEITEPNTSTDSSGEDTSHRISSPKKTPIYSPNGKIETESSIHTPKKYVLFVGNLPYDVTKEQVEDHFRKTGGVKAVRVPKVKGTDKAKGFAYVEFNSTISHRIALRLHQTTLGGRKINVEFTSIGGKNSNRKNRLKEKNAKLAKFKMPFDT